MLAYRKPTAMPPQLITETVLSTPQKQMGDA